MVCSVKVALRKTLGRSSLTTEQLLTVLTEIGGMINSRPITYVGSETEKPIPLTPAHFIIGKRIISLSPHVPRKVNIIADALSRIDELYLQPTIDYEEFNLDIIGPLPTSEGFRFSLTIIDRYSRWMEAFPMPDIRAETIAGNILKGWISRFGTPLVITTDQGTQFEAQLFRELSKLIGFKCNKTTTYHPQANGCIERWHRTLKVSIMCHENESWTRSLPIILLGLRTIWRADFEATPAELLYGESIRLPCDFFEDTLFQPQSEFVQTLKTTIKDFKPVPFSYHSK
ncbi:integrase catalytic domain-containing protein [Trichonephila clavipes]|nr:integrase catalytic domain-containing protein [Trichonephila clavipes]